MVQNQWNNVMQSKLYFFFPWTLPTTRHWKWRFGFWYCSCCHTICLTGYFTGCKKIVQRFFVEFNARNDWCWYEKRSHKQASKNTVTKTAIKNSFVVEVDKKNNQCFTKKKLSRSSKMKNNHSNESDQREVEQIFSQI